jgi:ectoine hydroxylase-related dioxygenase (phytanoyl-CoA dioxygenase family)
MALQNFGPTASAAEIAAATLRDGAAIVSGLVPTSLAETIAGELRENFDNFGYRSKRNFSGHKTSRCHAVLEDAPSSVALISQDMVMDVADAILLPHCESYRIGSITGIEVCPGQEVQELHRDDTVYPVRLPGMELQIGCMWALTDFTEENGATQVVPGSHRHITMGEQVDLSNCEQAVMSKGSALFYLGSTMHGAGVNRSNDARMGLITVYSLGWLRQEANQYLSVPWDIVRTYDERMRCLLGYTTHDKKGDRLGKYYGSDTSFVDKDNYARHYRPYQPDSKGEE